MAIASKRLRRRAVVSGYFLDHATRGAVGGIRVRKSALRHNPAALESSSVDDGHAADLILFLGIRVHSSMLVSAVSRCATGDDMQSLAERLEQIFSGRYGAGASDVRNP